VSGGPQPFDPYALLTALERERVTYVLIGGFARIIQGTEELTEGLDLGPSLRAENLRRLGLALDDLDARLPNGKRPGLDRDLPRQAVLQLQTEAGELKIVPQPAGTRGGYDDLRRAATREPIGKALRPRVASIGDLARMLAASAASKIYRRSSHSASLPNSNVRSSAESSADRRPEPGRPTAPRTATTHPDSRPDTDASSMQSASEFVYVYA
jgi:hypothetical protein